jgi:glucosamine--fructose-6-phosphate aminotransferase (isomerizing)
MIYDGDAIKLCKTKGKVGILKNELQREITTNGTVLDIRVGQHGVPND